ncbi:MAG: hypothetical protein BV458_11830, partial [Thermoplasmata archaeon M9B2D]
TAPRVLFVSSLGIALGFGTRQFYFCLMKGGRGMKIGMEVKSNVVVLGDKVICENTEIFPDNTRVEPFLVIDGEDDMVKISDIVFVNRLQFWKHYRLYVLESVLLLSIAIYLLVV